MAELPEQNQAGEPNEELVKVFDTEQESEAMVVRGCWRPTVSSR